MMRDSTKRRLGKLESRAAPMEFPKFVIQFVDSRVDADGSRWRRVASRWHQSTGLIEEVDEPWELVCHGSP